MYFFVVFFSQKENILYFLCVVPPSAIHSIGHLHLFPISKSTLARNQVNSQTQKRHCTASFRFRLMMLSEMEMLNKRKDNIIVKNSTSFNKMNIFPASLVNKIKKIICFPFSLGIIFC